MSATAEAQMAPPLVNEGDISLRGITRIFAGALPAVDHVDLDIRDGEFFTLRVHPAAARPPCCG